MVLVDTHCHLDFPEYQNLQGEVIARAKDAGVGYCLTIGIDEKSSREAIALSERFPGVYAAVGTHPHDAAKVTNDDFIFFDEAAKHKKVVAVGEIGLDFHYDNSPRRQQIEVFEKFLSLSKKNGLPSIFHIREAFGEFFDVIHRFNFTGEGVMHCFSGGLEEVRKILDLGLYVSFTGILTFKKAEIMRDVAKFVPMDRILLETDAPFLAPQSKRGKTNEPAYVLEVAEKLAEVKGISLVEVAEATTENCKRLFRFPKGD